MRTLEQQGKTVDDAINKALEELNVSRDQISVEILEEGSRGLFGFMGARPAKIRARVAQDASYNSIKEELRAVQQPETQEPKPREKKATEPVRKPQNAARSRGRSQERSSEKRPQERSEKRPQQRSEKRPQQRSVESQKERPVESPKERPVESPKERLVESPQEGPNERRKEQVSESPKEYDEKDIQQITVKAQESLAVILANLQVEYTVEVKRRDDQILMNIRCDNENFLIGRRGTTLDAVQYLVNRIANKDIEEKIQVVLDTSDYRINRQERLEKLALRLSKRVKTTGKSVTVAPMNPHDRRIIHLTLQDDSSIRTLSRGTGFMRRIIISSGRASSRRKPSEDTSVEDTRVEETQSEDMTIE